MLHKVKNSLMAPLLSLSFIVLSSSALTTFISVKMQIENFTETLIGIVQSGFYVGYLFGSLKAENIIKRIGYTRSFVFFAAIFGSVILLLGLYMNIFFWIFLRIISGLSIAALYVIIESWFLAVSDHATRGRILSIYMIALYASQSVSQLLIKVLDIKELTAFLVLGILCYFSIVPVSINYNKPPETSTGTVIKKSYREVYKATPFSFWGCLISGLILSSIYSFLPIFAQINGFNVSYIMTATIAGGFLLQWPIGLLSDIFDRKQVLVVTGILLTIPSILLYFNSENCWFCYTLCFLIGGFSFVIYPITLTNASERFDIKYIPFIIGLMSLLYGIGASIGPFLTSLFMEKSSVGIFLYITIMSMSLTSLGIYFRIKNPKNIPQEEKNEFTLLSESAPVGSEITTMAIEKNKPCGQPIASESPKISEPGPISAKEPVTSSETVENNDKNS